jgi:hypothetical protein
MAKRLLLLFATAWALCSCRDLAGGNQIDALQKAKTAAAAASAQSEKRFQEGLKAAGPSDQEIEAATGEPAP